MRGTAFNSPMTTREGNTRASLGAWLPSEHAHRHLQCEWRERQAACAAALAGRNRSRYRVPAGTESTEREIPAAGDQRRRL